MLLDATGVFEFTGVSEDAVETGEQLFGGEFFFVVGFGDFQHQKDAVDVEDLEAVEFAIIADSQNNQEDDYGDPHNRHKQEAQNVWHDEYIISN